MASAAGGSSGSKLTSPDGSLHCCEVCGAAELSEEQLRHHLRTVHVQDCSVCPLCEMVDPSADVIVIHVNEAHLDYLSPQSEIIDDSELYEDCMDTNTSSSSSSNDQSSCAATSKQREPNKPTPSNTSEHRSQTHVAGGGAVSKRAPLTDASNAQTSKTDRRSDSFNQSDGAGDRSKRMTKSASNSPARRKAVSNLNERSAPIMTIDDNCNLHVVGGNNNNNNSSSHSSPSRSHLSLNLNTQPTTSGTRDGASRRELFAGSRSNSTPLTGTGSLQSRVAGQNCDDVQLLDVVTKCPICGRREDNPQDMERHINQVHFDTASPNVDGATALTATATALKCPLCFVSFETVQDLELHVNIAHQDILSPPSGRPPHSAMEATTAAATASNEALCSRGGSGNNGGGSGGSSSSTLASNNGSSDDDGCCLVCGRSGFSDNASLAVHMDAHFNRKPSSVSPEVSEAMAASMEKKEKDIQRMRERQEFSQLQVKYGMDGCGSFKQQYVDSMQRAVYNGEMSINDYYERKIQLVQVERTGMDDGSTRTKGILTSLLPLSLQCREVRYTLLCSAIDHYGSTIGDKGWGCGYRNTQMLLSCLQHHTGYYERLFAAPDAIPSIAALQGLIEKAWGCGFDAQGCEQLGGKLTNTRKWIGATELTTLLSSFRIKCELLDFHRPTAIDGTHPELFSWCRSYFGSSLDFKPPLYLQHQGHSRTIIGCEVLHGDKEDVRLLILDPSHSSRQLLALVQPDNDGYSDQPSREPFAAVNPAGGGGSAAAASGRGGGGGGRGGAHNTVGYTCAGAKVVTADNWIPAGRGSTTRGGGRGRGAKFKGGNSNGAGFKGGNNTAGGTLRLLRRPLRTMKAHQYQVVRVVGVMDSDDQYQNSKVLQSTRIPKT